MSCLSMEVEKFLDNDWGSCESFDKDQRMTTAKVFQEETQSKGSEGHRLKVMLCI